ncbi:MAG TPA: zinc ribbon domain-containing protein, partial [Sphingorhabdus sp.]|nr:zinc ribbon domain-containing protein [Sphingorhabdus sp.]
MAKYCIQCGTALNEGARFCGQCGAVVPVAGVDSPATASEPLAATPAYAAVEHYEPASDGGVDDKKGPNWLLIGGGAGLIVLLVLYYFLFLHDDMAGDSLEDRIQPTEVSEEVAISKEFYAVTEANIRDKASTEGSTVLGKLSRGTAATGKLIVGGDGTSNWLELADGKSKSFALDVWRETYADPIAAPAAKSCDALACIGQSSAGFTWAIVTDASA